MLLPELLLAATRRTARVEGHICGNASDPRSKGPPPFESVKSAIRLQDCLLGHVFRQVMPAHNPDRHGKNTPLMAAYKFLVGEQIPALGLNDQVLFQGGIPCLRLRLLLGNTDDEVRLFRGFLTTREP